MKIRNGFVTNSSSSSFILKIKKPKTTTKKFSFGEIEVLEEGLEDTQDLKYLLEDTNIYDADIETINSSEELDQVLNGSSYRGTTEDLLNGYINENVVENLLCPGETSEDVINDLKAVFEDYYLVAIDVNRSNTSGYFTKIIIDYIRLKNLGEIIYSDCD